MRSRAHATNESRAEAAADADAQHAQEADVWDVVDPAYATMNTWSNIQGVLFAPSWNPPQIPSWSELVPGSHHDDDDDDDGDGNGNGHGNGRDDAHSIAPSEMIDGSETGAIPPQDPSSPLNRLQRLNSRRSSNTSQHQHGRFLSAIPSFRRHYSSPDPVPRKRFASFGHRGSTSGLSGTSGPSSPSGPLAPRIVPQTTLTPPPERPSMDPLGATSSEEQPTVTLTQPSTTHVDRWASGGDLSIDRPIDASTGFSDKFDWDWNNRFGSSIKPTHAPESEQNVPPYDGDAGLNDDTVVGTRPSTAPWSMPDHDTSQPTTTPEESFGQVPVLPPKPPQETEGTKVQLDDSELIASKMEYEARLAMEQAEEEEAVEAAVARLMTSRERFRRGLIGFGRYLRTPLGFLMVLYGLLVAAWGIAIFILIVRWWNPPHRRVWIERCDKILCCLFNLTGFLLAPSRLRDSYRIGRISLLRRKALRQRETLGLNPLPDPNDLPRSYAYRLYDTNRRRHLSPTQAAQAAHETVKQAKQAEQARKTKNSNDHHDHNNHGQRKHERKHTLTKPHERRVRKKLAADEVGVRDRVHGSTAAQAEMQVAEEAAAVAVAVAQGGHTPYPSTSPVPRGATPATPVTPIRAHKHSTSMRSLGSVVSASPQPLDLAQPPKGKPHALKRMWNATIHPVGLVKRRKPHSAATPTTGPGSPMGNIPDPDPELGGEGDRSEVLTSTPVPVSSADAYNSHSPTTPPPPSKTPPPRPSLQVNTRIVHPHPHYASDYQAPPGHVARPPSTAPLLDTSGSIPSFTSDTPHPHSTTPAPIRPQIRVRSRSEYRAPKIVPGTEGYLVSNDTKDSDTKDTDLVSPPSTEESVTRLATVVPFHTITPVGVQLTAEALASGAAVLVEGSDGRIAYAIPDDAEPAVLSLAEESQLVYQQRKFRSAHPYYRYHETETHRAFSATLAIAIVILSDLHSCLQVCLCGVTWGISYHRRPTALTAAIISCSLSCNALAGLLIWIGGRKTKKTEVIHAQLMKGLEAEARKRVRRARALEARALDLAAQGKDPYPFQLKGPAALFKLNLYDLDGRHELEQIHGPFPDPKEPKGKQLWRRLWGQPDNTLPPTPPHPPPPPATSTELKAKEQQSQQQPPQQHQQQNQRRSSHNASSPTPPPLRPSAIRIDSKPFLHPLASSTSRVPSPISSQITPEPKDSDPTLSHLSIKSGKPRDMNDHVLYPPLPSVSRDESPSSTSWKPGFESQGSSFSSTGFPSNGINGVNQSIHPLEPMTSPHDVGYLYSEQQEFLSPVESPIPASHSTQSFPRPPRAHPVVTPTYPTPTPKER